MPPLTRITILAGAALALLAAPGFAVVPERASTPPPPRPPLVVSSTKAVAMPLVAPRPRPDRTLAAAPATPAPPVSRRSPDARAVAAAMTEIRRGGWSAALQAARPAGEVGIDLVNWHRLRAGRGEFSEYRAFLAENADWPGLALMKRRGERSILPGADPDAVLAYFGDDLPETGAGVVRLIEAHEAAGDSDRARTLATYAWTSLVMRPTDEARLYTRYPEALSDHHATRLDLLLWEGEAEAARRMFPRVSDGYRALAEARLALAANASGVDDRIAAVPEALADDPGLAHARFAWRLRKDRDEDAIALMRAQSDSAKTLGRPEIWADDRGWIGRALMRAGEAEAAYDVASRHHLTSGSDFADLEWLSGYLSLTYLDDADQALRHFRNFRAAVRTPISLGRAGYWEGRALEALGRMDEARVAFEFGGEHQTSFYGQLAAERAGLPMDPALAGRDALPDWETADFAASEVLRAALLLQEAGERRLAARFMRHLAESLDETELGQLGDLALSLDEPFIALLVAKQAARQGIIVPRAYFPVTDLGSGELAVPRELALAIARRESEFYPLAVSGAGARGLMQLMPQTARAMAGRLDLPYRLERLLSDPAYNAALGSEYLSVLQDRFGTAYPLIAAGYNAGPGRPIRWMERFGDPRASTVDAVDWVEHIPFTETRNYVMRVMESLAVYRARLSGGPVPLRLSAELKGL